MANNEPIVFQKDFVFQKDPVFRQESGMTLLEVMVALAIFAIAGIAALSASNNAIQGQVGLEEKTLATWIADNQLVELNLQKVWPNNAWQSKKINFADQEWFVRWHGVETPQVGLKALDIEVAKYEFRPDDTPPIITSVRTYVVKEMN